MSQTLLYGKYRIKPGTARRYISKVTGHEVNLDSASEALLERLHKGGDPRITLVKPKTPPEEK